MISTRRFINIPSPDEHVLCGKCVEVHSAFPLTTATLMFVRSQVLIIGNYVQKILSEPLTTSLSICLWTYLALICRTALM